MVKLILVRHGESVWNKENRFTGWVDDTLSKKGIKEAKQAGKKMLQNKIRFDSIYTSELARAHQTLYHILEVMKLYNVIFHSENKEIENKEKHKILNKELPAHKTIALNERNYGDLQGYNKDAMRKKFGKEQVHLWRRSFNVRPPDGESLKDTLKRVEAYFKKHILKDLKENKNVLVVAHGNSLRAITMYLEKLSSKEIMKIEIPLGVPIVYHFDRDMNIKSKKVL